MTKLPLRRRIKERYNPTPTAREKRFHEWTYTDRLCICCDRAASVFHHLLQSTPSKRWRRDHEVGVPLNWSCHQDLHRAGSENAYKSDIDWAGEAERIRALAYSEGVL